MCELSELSKGTRVFSNMWGSGTVEAIVYKHYLTSSGWTSSGSNPQLDYIAVWHDSEYVRRTIGREHGGYCIYRIPHHLFLSEVDSVWADIPTAHCPQCEIEEMIFYEGDYICAWCREKLEE